jgi:hypothetical protein
MMLNLINDIAGYWLVKKQWLVASIGLTNDALHIHGSLLLLFGSALLLRKRPDNIWSWLFVFGLELFNEYADLHGKTPGEDSIAAAMHDILNTMFWPTLILLSGWLFFPRALRKPVVKGEDPSGDFADQRLKQTPAV